MASLRPEEVSIGQEVDIESRTWPGINKPGGHAKITKINSDENGAVASVDVRYVLGGTEKSVELTYVRRYEDVSRTAKSRQRRSNVAEKMAEKEKERAEEAAQEEQKRKARKKAMKKAKKKGTPSKEGKENEDTSGNAKSKSSSKTKDSKNDGTKKKRKALATIDANTDKTKKVKSGSLSDASSDVLKGEKWLLVENGNTTDYTKYLQQGHIIYYRRDDGGWARGYITKGIREETANKWVVAVKFKEGPIESLTFSCLNKRWKILESCLSVTDAVSRELNQSAAKSAVVDVPASGESNKITTDATNHSTTPKSNESNANQTPKPENNKPCAVGAAKKSSNSKETNENHSTTKNTASITPNDDVNSKKAGYDTHVSSGNTVLPMLKQPQKEMYAAAGVYAFPKVIRKVSTSKSKTNKVTPVATDFKANSKVAANDPHAGQTAASAQKSAASGTKFRYSNEILARAERAYKDRCSKGTKFMDEIIREEEYARECKKHSRESDQSEKISSEKETGEDRKEEPKKRVDNLDLRKENFTRTICEIMTKNNLDSLDVEELMSKVCPPPDQKLTICDPDPDKETLLRLQTQFAEWEVKSYLKRLHVENRIFFVEEEGNKGTIYRI